MKRVWLLFLCACGSGGGGPDGGAPDSGAAMVDARVLTIDERLRQIDGLTVVAELPNPPFGYHAFALEIDQPEDHAAPGGKHFAQQLILLHRADDAPVVVYTTGYYLPGNVRARSEPAIIVDGNQIAVEHRFFLPSRPDDPDWDKLTIEQSANDFHAVVRAFRLIYPESAFISTGGSKGGMTVLFHRRFFPDDVDGTVAYVSPISLGGPDLRYVAFMHAIGLADCRAQLEAFQREALTRREAMVQRMDQNGYHYTALGTDKALEHFTLELSFVFWQYNRPSRCADIPATTATDDEVYNFLNSGVASASLNDPSDEEIDQFVPYFYQAGTQLGFPKIDEAPFADLVVYPNTDVAASYTPGLSSVYDDGAAMNDVVDWVKTEGHALLFVYGEYDPWTAAAVDLGNATDSFRFLVAAGNHGSRISQLAGVDLATAEAAVRRWARVAATPGKPTIPEDDEPPEMPRLRP
jgi:hypothetical protein